MVLPMVLYMTSSFWLLQVESHVFLKLRKKELLAKLSNLIFTQKDNLRPSFCEFAQFCKQFFLSHLEKNHMTQLGTAENFMFM